MRNFDLNNFLKNYSKGVSVFFIDDIYFYYHNIYTNCDDYRNGDFSFFKGWSVIRNEINLIYKFKSTYGTFSECSHFENRYEDLEKLEKKIEKTPSIENISIFNYSKNIIETEKLKTPIMNFSILIKRNTFIIKFAVLKPTEELSIIEDF